MQSKGEISPSNQSFSKSETKLSSAPGPGQRKSRAERQERISKAFDQDPKKKYGENIEQLEPNQNSDSMKKRRASKNVTIVLDDIPDRGLKSSKPSVSKQNENYYVKTTQRLSLNDVQGSKMTSSHAKLNNITTEKIYGTGQLSAYFQNKTKNNNLSSQSFRRPNNAYKSNEKQFSMTQDNGKINKTMKSSNHTAAETSVQNLKTSFLNQAVQAKNAQKFLRVGRKDEQASRNVGIAAANSGSKGNKGSQNFSINSRINNPRPLNNLTKNFLHLSQNRIDDEEYDQVSMSSFEERPKIPATTKNNHRGTKKIQFDEIMKGINMDKSESPIKQSLRNQKNIKEIHGSKTFVAPHNVTNMIVKKAPLTTKNQTKITTISFNTNQNTSPFPKNLRNEDKQKSLIKSKLLQHTRTGVQSPKITSATFAEKSNGPFKTIAQQSPNHREIKSKGQTYITNLYKRGYATKSKPFIQKKNETNIKSVTLISNQKQSSHVVKSKTINQQDEQSQEIPNARRNAGSIQPSKHDFTNKYVNNYFSKSSIVKKKQAEEVLEEEDPSYGRHPNEEAEKIKVKIKNNYITQKQITQSYSTVQNKTNSFLLHSKSMNTLQQQLNQESSIQNEEASVELVGLNASNVFSKHNKQTEKSEEILYEKTVPQASGKSKSYHNIKSMYDSTNKQEVNGGKKKIQHYLKNNLVMKNVKQNQTFHHNVKQEPRTSKAGAQIVGGISFRDQSHQYNYSMIENKNDQMNTARNLINQSYNDLGKQMNNAKNQQYSKSIKNMHSESKRSEDYEKAPNDQNEMVKNRKFSAHINLSKEKNQSITSKYMSNNKPIMEDQEEQNVIASDFKPYDSSSKKFSGEKDPVESSIFDHRSPMKETDIIAELKGDSPLEDSRHIKKENSEKVKIKKYASITSEKSRQKNEITIKIENSKENQFKKDELKKIQSNKTISIEKSEVTKSSPHSKIIEKTFKKASNITQNIAKTSISNPVNRLSSLSGQKQLNTPVEYAKRNTPDFPMTAEDAKKHFKLTDFEIVEIHLYDKKIYYAGQKCNTKVKGHPIKYVTVSNSQPNNSFLEQSRKSIHRQNSKKAIETTSANPKQIPSTRQKDRLESMNIFNYGYDDDQGDYKTQVNDHLGYRFQVVKSLGSGSFGQALECLDHKTNEMVAVKIIRNQKKFQYQAGMELKILKYLNYNDKNDQNNIIRVKDYMIFREHLIISFELLSINLYEFIKKNDFRGVTQNLIRRFAIQILQALKFQQSLNLVHCDLKPENILLKQERKSGIKMIDYGSSCFLGQRIYTYIQSRFYRAPEIILGIPYTTAIDMWSFGAIVAELYTGYPLFPGEDEVEQLAYIMEIYGVPTKEIIKMSTRGHLFFHKTGDPILSANSKGKIRKPCTKSLQQILRCNDENFIDFLNKCFIWNPCERMTPLEALQHPWILEGLPEKVLKSHTKMFGSIDEKQTIKKATFTSIQGFPPDKKDVTIYQMIEEQIKDDAKREAALHRKQNSEIGVLKSDHLLTKKESIIEEKSPKKSNQQFSNYNDDTPNTGNRERKSRKQRLTRISEQNVDKMGNSISQPSELKEDEAENESESERDMKVQEMDLISPINSN